MATITSPQPLAPNNQPTVIPANPKANYLAYKDEIDVAIAQVLESGYYLVGEQTAAFEEEFAAYIGVKHGIAVGSGTEALHLALRAANVGPGNEVITVSHTAVATVAAIELAGATPVFVDIDPSTFTMDVSQLETVLSPRTKAIIPVHIYGHPVGMVAVLEFAQTHGLTVLEDCAQSHGAKLGGQMTGSWGDLAAFSFYPTKNLSALGDAGMVVTDDDALAHKLRLLRQYGWEERYVSAIPGMNSRIDEMQAAILRVKLRHLDADNFRRGEIACKYAGGLAHLPIELPQMSADVQHVFHQYVIRAEQRDSLQQQLRERGIICLIHYPVPVHQQPAYQGRIPLAISLPHTEAAAQQILSLPLYPELPEEHINHITTTFEVLLAKQTTVVVEN